MYWTQIRNHHIIEKNPQEDLVLKKEKEEEDKQFIHLLATLKGL